MIKKFGSFIPAQKTSATGKGCREIFGLMRGEKQIMSREEREGGEGVEGMKNKLKTETKKLAVGSWQLAAKT